MGPLHLRKRRADDLPAAIAAVKNTLWIAWPAFSAIYLVDI
jgi:hypothetical protein